MGRCVPARTEHEKHSSKTYLYCRASALQTDHGGTRWPTAVYSGCSFRVPFIACAPRTRPYVRLYVIYIYIYRARYRGIVVRIVSVFSFHFFLFLSVSPPVRSNSPCPRARARSPARSVGVHSAQPVQLPETRTVFADEPSKNFNSIQCSVCERESPRDTPAGRSLVHS